MASPITCPSCRHDNDPWRKHCGGCGSHLPGGCTACGVVNGPTDRFCGGCAKAVRRAGPRPKAKVKEKVEHTMPIDVLTDVLP